ncbi:myosin light chain kinase family member 4 isoform X1 [Pantherophis guttatus]|uniref:Myosin light chain kinase family member 4 isoform X1 n=1 Tax=Pantherophis guttatus TaxID=94885 RepID=A0A6P9CP17_PANGU|nr:myosin light chain kinase family member 4 isoform X1 [Pantherophis guttatus]
MEEIGKAATAKKLMMSDMKLVCTHVKKKFSEMAKNDDQHKPRLEEVEQVILEVQQHVGSLEGELKTFTLTDPICRKEAPYNVLRVGDSLKKDKSESCFRMQMFSDKKETSFNKWNEKEKSYLTAKGTKSIKKKKMPDSSVLDGSDEKSESHSHTEKVHKLNKENTGKPNTFLVQRNSPKSCESKECAERRHSISWKSSLQKTSGKSPVEVNANEANQSQNNPDAEGDDPGLVKKHGGSQGSLGNVVEDDKRKDITRDEKAGVSEKRSQRKKSIEDADIKHKGNEKASFFLKDEQASSSKRRVNEGSFLKDVNKKSRVFVVKASGGLKPKEAAKPKTTELVLPGKTVASKSTAANKNKVKQEASKGDNFIIDNIPSTPAPFDHKMIKAKGAGIGSFYQIFKNELLGGGRFGQVHKCEEKETGLKLAAKIIKARSLKEKDEVKNEINIMNQLTHMNIIQLYDAFESKNDVVLIMEYVEGGELFDRILDENSNLTEMDAILFIKQICEGIQHMHQMYILHLDLKPENILCVNREEYQIKIIDFGLARRYKPREKLKVNFGTPEFLAPEVVNYDFVSFPTDMWSIGVIAYMLITGLSPFLGDDDNETLNNILACSWDFEDEEFKNVSEEAKDFISKLLIKEKCWRISAGAALKHPWLSNQTLHCKLEAKKKKKKCSSPF